VVTSTKQAGLESILLLVSVGDVGDGVVGGGVGDVGGGDCHVGALFGAGCGVEKGTDLGEGRRVGLRR
jgi:hypothetical protein